MNTTTKFTQGSAEWFDMLGTILCDAVRNADLPPGHTVSFVERYIDSEELAPGLIKGFRFEIKNGEPSYRPGVAPDEMGDVTIDLTVKAARELNLLYTADPRFREQFDHYISIGEAIFHGDIADVGEWIHTIHDPIVDRTC
ncbi:hypothetical protein [Sphingomonas sp. Root710]|uniref:hypothetical protein n=1 Tax=Sphingomonas sp. Root710 TaxID=1736594 RepID=UPI000A818E46|nr:hypothetical protein [Sphingomonas sp. Root710]